MIVTSSHWHWWLRWVETRIVTDEGSFADSFVPDDYGGPQLTINVVQRVLVCTQSGHFQMLTFGSADKVMDDQRKKGMGIYIEPFGENEGSAVIPEETLEGPGPSENVVVWVVEENPMMSAEFKTRMLYAYKAALANLEQ